MELTLNNIQMTLKADNRPDGTYLTITTHVGQWEQRVSDQQLPTATDEDVASAFEIVLEILVDMEQCSSFRAFCDMVEHGGGGQLTDKDREWFNHWQDRYQEFNNVTCHTACEMMDYIQKEYDL